MSVTFILRKFDDVEIRKIIKFYRAAVKMFWENVLYQNI